MSICRVFSCVVGRGCLLWPMCSLGKTALPCFIPYSKAKFACYSRCFLTSYFCIPVPYNEKDIFFGFKAQLLSSSRWVITPSWLSGSWRSFLCSSSVYSCHLFLVSSVSVRFIPFPSYFWAHLCMIYSRGISNFLEEISSFSHSISFLYFFALIYEKGLAIKI